MDFAKDILSFPSTVHRDVYNAARCLTPLAVSLPSVADPALRDSCALYHGFLMTMLSDMYDNPQAYHLPVFALEKHLSGQKLNAALRSAPKETESVLSQTRNAVAGYQKLLYLLGQKGCVNGDALILSQDDGAVIAKLVNTSVSPVSLDRRLEALSRVGLTKSGDGLVSGRFPGMFPAMRALANAHQTKPGKCSGFGFFAFQNAEFRNITKAYKPTPGDYYNPLTKERKACAEKLHDWAIDNKLRPDVSTFRKVNYKYKGNQTMCVESLDGVVRVRVTISYGETEALDERLRRESPETQKYALRHLHRCTLCNPQCGGPFMTLLGKKQRRCGGFVGFRWLDPEDCDIEMIKHIAGYRASMIDDGQVNKCGE